MLEYAEVCRPQERINYKIKVISLSRFTVPMLAAVIKEINTWSWLLVELGELRLQRKLCLDLTSPCSHSM